ncbi:MAG: heavy metal-binding domain-containing protein [Actinomycetota bacterium]
MSNNPPAGWYPDPTDASRMRYWDGNAWSEQFAAAQPAELTMPASTTFDLHGMVIERQIGLVWGLVVRSVGFAKGFTAGFTALAAGEVPQYTEVVDKARHHALSRLFEHVQAVGGNAVVGVRFDTAEIGQGIAEIVAYGTAVVANPIP